MLDAVPNVYVVDDDADLAGSLARLLIRRGFLAEPLTDPRKLLASYESAPAACVVTDIMMGEMDGFAFADRLRSLDPAAAVVFMTAWPTTANAVDSIRRYGGLDYLEKPIDQERLLSAVREGILWSNGRRTQAARIAQLSPRERDVFALLVRGLSSKAIAAELGLSAKTIEDHRSKISAKTKTTGLAALIELGSGIF